MAILAVVAAVTLSGSPRFNEGSNFQVLSDANHDGWQVIQLVGADGEIIWTGEVNFSAPANVIGLANGEMIILQKGRDY